MQSIQSIQSSQSMMKDKKRIDKMSFWLEVVVVSWRVKNERSSLWLWCLVGVVCVVSLSLHVLVGLPRMSSCPLSMMMIRVLLFFSSASPCIHHIVLTSCQSLLSRHSVRVITYVQCRFVHWKTFPSSRNASF